MSVRRYAIDGSAINTVNVTLLALEGATTIKPGIYDIVLGSAATPADQAAEYTLNRFTVAGTTTALAETPLDPDFPASLCTAGQPAITAEPTYTADEIVLAFSLNQRATFRWVAAPDGELVIPATAANGLGLRGVIVTAAVIVESMIHFQE